MHFDNREENMAHEGGYNNRSGIVVYTARGDLRVASVFSSCGIVTRRQGRHGNKWRSIYEVVR